MATGPHTAKPESNMEWRTHFFHINSFVVMGSAWKFGLYIGQCKALNSANWSKFSDCSPE